MSSGLLGFMSAYHHNIKLLPGFKPPFPTEHDMQSLTECPSGPLASVGHYIHIADFIRVPPLLFAFGLCLSFPSQSQDWSEIIIVALRRKLINLWRGNYSSRQCGFNVIHACTQISFFFFFFSKCITQTESLWTEGQSEQNCNALKNFFAHSKKMRPGRKMLDAFSFSCSVILKTQALTNYFSAGENTRQNENSQGTSVLRVYNSEERNKLFLWTLHKKTHFLWFMHIGPHFPCQQTTDHTSWARLRAPNRQHGWQMLREEPRLVLRGGCFRIPQRAVSRSASWRGGDCRVCAETSHSFPEE